jgi:hypothetical protein
MTCVKKEREENHVDKGAAASMDGWIHLGLSNQWLGKMAGGRQVSKPAMKQSSLIYK